MIEAQEVKGIEAQEVKGALEVGTVEVLRLKLLYEYLELKDKIYNCLIVSNKKY